MKRWLTCVVSHWLVRIEGTGVVSEGIVQRVHDRVDSERFSEW